MAKKKAIEPTEDEEWAEEDMNASTATEEGEEPQLILEKFVGGLSDTRKRFLVYGESGVGKTVFASSWGSATMKANCSVSCR